jgi:hypothetical protein
MVAEPVRQHRAAWLEGLFLALLVFIVLAMGGESVRASYHGYLHTTVGEAVLRDGLLPENPYHAGTPLRYYTLFPTLGVLLGKLGMGPLWGFALLNILAALLFAPALDSLGRSFDLRFSARRATFWAAVLGFNALGWLGFFFNGQSLPPEAPPVFQLAPLTFSEWPLHWDQRLQAFLPKFLNVSSFALALPFALWTLAVANRGADERGTHQARRGILPAALTLALNPLVGAFTGLCMFGWLIPRFVRWPAPSKLAWAGAGVAACLLALPFLLPAFQVEPVSSNRVEVQLGGQPLWDFLGPLCLLLPMAILGLKYWSKPHLLRFGFAAFVACGLLLFGGFPWGNEYKFARIGAILWAIPAGTWISRWDTFPKFKWALLFCLALPTTTAVPNAYLKWGHASPPMPLQNDSGSLGLPIESGAPWSSLIAEMRSIDSSAVCLLDPYGFPGLGAGRVQGSPLAPALSHPLVVDVLHVHNEGQLDLSKRMELCQSFFHSKSESDSLAALKSLRLLFPHRPMLVLLPEGRKEPPIEMSSWDSGGFSLWHLPAPEPDA